MLNAKPSGFSFLEVHRWDTVLTTVPIPGRVISIRHGYAARLEAMGMHTMGDVARMSVKCEDVLYRAFGVNAELLIDHAWGWEPVTIAEIKAYMPESSSISSGQVLQDPYEFDKGKLVAREMTDQLALDLVEKHLMTDQLILTVGYDTSNLTDPMRRMRYNGPVHINHYGKPVPKEAHGPKARTGRAGGRRTEPPSRRAHRPSAGPPESDHRILRSR